MSPQNTIEKNTRCPVCLKNLQVLKQKGIIENNGIRYCTNDCLEIADKQNSNTSD